MSLNLRFDQRVVIDTTQQPWVESPLPGVWRKPLAREQAERGHATSVVRYDSGSSFSAHAHPRGEEILVLDGVFSDEHGSFGAGTYFRNPPGTSHAPFSDQGCLLFVKLHQFLPQDRQAVCIDTTVADWETVAPGRRSLTLFESDHEQVFLADWDDGAGMQQHEHARGEEILVLSGELRDEHGRYGAGTWLRNPPGSSHRPYAVGNTRIWLKTGHLPVS